MAEITAEELEPYKGFTGSVEFEDGIPHGKILNIADLVTYEADVIEGIQQAFEDSVNEYLSDCAVIGKMPVLSVPFVDLERLRESEAMLELLVHEGDLYQFEDGAYETYRRDECSALNSRRVHDSWRDAIREAMATKGGRE